MKTAINCAELASDCIEVMKCVPINAEQFENGLANSGQDKPTYSMAPRVFNGRVGVNKMRDA